MRRCWQRTEEAGKPGRRVFPEGGKSQGDYLLQASEQENEREATDVKLQQEVRGDFCLWRGKEQRWLL